MIVIVATYMLSKNHSSVEAEIALVIIMVVVPTSNIRIVADIVLIMCFVVVNIAAGIMW